MRMASDENIKFTDLESINSLVHILMARRVCFVDLCRDDCRRNSFGLQAVVGCCRPNEIDKTRS